MFGVVEKYIRVFLALPLLVCGGMTHAQYESQSARITQTPASDQIPDYTIQVDVFDSWVSAVEYGFELPFDANALGVAKYETEGVLKYILALGSFYTFDEAQTVLSDVCSRYALNQCQVRFLGRLEDIAEAEVAKNTQVDQTLLLAQTAEDIPLLTSGALVATTERNLPVVEKRGAYTIQIAAMYDKSHAEETAERVPASYGKTIIEPIASENGDIIYTITVGQFDSVTEARELATQACREMELYGCWVKPQLANY